MKLPHIHLRRTMRQLGPGLITGAADDDPSGIATYSQAGAQFGFAMVWTVVFTLPLMAAIQVVSARIGYVTRRGLAANIRSSFPRPVLLAVVGMLVVANTLNLSAVINGVIAIPVMVVMMLIASSPRDMGTHVIGVRLRVMGWLATAAMAFTVVAMLVTR